MSRLAKKPIQIPAKVTVTSLDGILTVKGPKDTLSRSIHPTISIEVTSEGVVITANNSSKLAKALTGTFAALTKAMVDGVETPFKKVLILNGVGYKVELKGNELVFAVGFSHPVVLKVPEGITATVVKTTIKYDDEVIRRKQGKKAV
jgi:large subunit ribosomal protein L6